tara:strand:- start:58 stop:492 length:435 start_codon:yes stop_codon:yes gene_type:complete
MIVYKKITGNTAKVLIDLNETTTSGSGGKDYHADSKFFSTLKAISFCNLHDTDSAYLDLYYSAYSYALAEENNHDGVLVPAIHPTNRFIVTSTDYYIVKNLDIQKGDTFFLEKEDLIDFDNTRYSLSMKLNAADSAVDVIIDKK